MPPLNDLRAQIEGQREYLLRFATLQLRDPHAAEDAVQETLLAALTGAAGFEGRSNLRTWLTGILKHKIVDAIRRTSREPSRPDEALESLSEFDSLFDARGHWSERPSPWASPESAFAEKEFFRVLEGCLAGLPAKTARAFMMREHLGLETEAICKELDITPTHCWVLLYRARMALRQCLSARWFGDKDPKPKS